MKHKIIFENNVFELLYKNKSIKDRISIISKKLNELYENRNVLFIGILNGCNPFLNDLLKKITFKYNVKYIKINSYVGIEKKDIYKVKQ